MLENPERLKKALGRKQLLLQKSKVWKSTPDLNIVAVKPLLLC